MKDQRLQRTGVTRAIQVRQMLTGAGFTGLVSKDQHIYGVPGWRIIVTTQDDIITAGKTIFARLLDLNAETRTAIIRARAMGTRTPKPTVGDSQVLVRLEDWIELLAYRHEHERKCGHE